MLFIEDIMVKEEGGVCNVVDSILVHIHSAAYHDRHDLRAGIAVDNGLGQQNRGTIFHFSGIACGH
ncbi:hypothetical protein IMSAGC006_02131 [Muribaculaceae bacterium]|nr:hypothetical protein IMSAGC006_02131 [Muribaculaceae bacterium]